MCYQVSGEEGARDLPAPAQLVFLGRKLHLTCDNAPPLEFTATKRTAHRPVQIGILRAGPAGPGTHKGVTMIKGMNSTASRRQFVTGALGATGAVAAGAAAASIAQAAESATQWDYEYDFVVCGSGTGIWGALAAKASGLDKVLIVEQRELLGGTAALSTGCFWLPMNHFMADNGDPDSREKVIQYITAIAEGQSRDDLIEAYVDHSEVFVTWAEDALDVTWQQFGTDALASWDGFLIYKDLPSARTGRTLGIAVTGDSASTGEQLGKFGPVMWQHLAEKVDELGIDSMLNTSASDLVVENGAVVGLVATDKDGNEVHIRADKGVLLSTGGFDYNEEWRATYLRTPVFNTIQVEGNDGTGIRMGIDAGAELGNIASNYGCPYWKPVGEEYPENIATNPGVRFDADAQRNYPHSLIANRTGRRFGDESSSYCIFNRAFEGWHSGTCQVENIPGYFIANAQFAEHYVLPTAKAVGEVPDGMIVADTLEELAAACDIDVDGLLDEVETFNRFCETGVDLEWHRGEGRFDTLSHSTEDMPEDLVNPSLGTVEKGPFYCIAYLPDTLGTSGGLKIDGEALMSGSFVRPGLVAARVDHVGAENYAAKIVAEAKRRKAPNSEIMRSLNGIIRFVSVAIVPVGIALYLATRNTGVAQDPAILSTVAALVGMVPEGLILLTSTVLALAVIRLSQRNVLVQQLYCIETLARVDTLWPGRAPPLPEHAPGATTRASPLPRSRAPPVPEALPFPATGS